MRHRGVFWQHRVPLASRCWLRGGCRRSCQLRTAGGQNSHCRYRGSLDKLLCSAEEHSLVVPQHLPYSLLRATITSMGAVHVACAAKVLSVTVHARMSSMEASCWQQSCTTTCLCYMPYFCGEVGPDAWPLALWLPGVRLKNMACTEAWGCVRPPHEPNTAGELMSLLRTAAASSLS
jgi:hypothetical protein